MKYFAKLALVFAILGAFILTGCSDMFSPAASRTRGSGLTISVSGNAEQGQGARTLYPTAAFTKYVLKFEGPELGYQADVEITGSTATVNLMDGAWTISATGYVEINGAEYEAAHGSAEVTMPQTSINIPISAKQDEGQGFFLYDIEYPVDGTVEEAGLWIFTFGETEADGEYVDLMAEAESPGRASGKLTLDSGYYMMIVRLSNELQMAVRTEIVHIYSNMETEAPRVFTADDFSGVITLAGTADVKLGGNPVDFDLTVKLANGSYIGEPVVNAGGEWSIKFEEPESDMIVEVTVAEGVVEIAHITPVILGTTDLENINISLNVTASIAGDYKVGQALTVTQSGFTSPAFRWQADGVDIEGAAAATYTVAGENVAKVLDCFIDYGGDGSFVKFSGVKVPYTVKLVKGGAGVPNASDFISFGASSSAEVLETTAHEGETLTLSYNLASTASVFDELHFEGLMDIASVTTPESDAKDYVVDPAHAASGVITITASFEHTSLARDDINFTVKGPVTVTYGDNGNEFDNPIIPPGEDGGYLGSGAITYSSSNTAYATVNSDGLVTIIRAGFTVVITATKPGDATYRNSTASYSLTVERKKINIIQLEAQDKIYNGTTAVTFVVGYMGPEAGTTYNGELVAFGTVTGSFADKNAGTDKPVVNLVIPMANSSPSWNYEAVPPEVTANIEQKDVTISALSVAAKEWDGAKLGRVTTTLDSSRISGRITGDDVYPVGGIAEFATSEIANSQVVTFSDWTLGGTDANNYNLTAQPASTTANLVKANLSAELWPVGITAVYGQMLSDIPLTLYNTTLVNGMGTFTWQRPPTYITPSRVGLNNYYMTYTPNDTAHFNTQNVYVAVRVFLNHEMVAVPPGGPTYTFTMGQTNIAASSPQHTVNFTSGFKIGSKQVTQQQYELVTGTSLVVQQNLVTDNVNAGRSNNHPMYFVNWYEAIRFCNLLSMAEGLTPAYSINGSTDPADWGTVPSTSNVAWNAAVVVAGSTGYRLPTEAQWEYACRAGTTGEYYWSGLADNTANNYGWSTGNCAGNSGSTRSQPVGGKLPNAWGLYDMSGNVWELCWDWYAAGYLASAQTDPTGPVSGTNRVIRGGSWYNTATNMRSAFRNYNNPYDRYRYIGFRLVCP